jgi:hydroxypyruvate reductase
MPSPSAPLDDPCALAARRLLLELFQAALARVEGGAAVRSALAGDRPERAALLAVGKAADAMARGAADVLGDGLVSGIIVTKYGHGDPEHWRRQPIEYLESAHPVPDRNSLVAGERVVAYVQRLPAGLPLLCLISGGASALLESLWPGVDLALLQRANAWLLGSGLDIHQVNRVRLGLSRIKGGGLLRYCGARPVTGLYISDVAGDDPAVIGSGLLGPPPAATLPEGLPDWLRGALHPLQPAPAAGAVQRRVVASLEHALAAVVAAGESRGCPVRRAAAPLAGDAVQAARRIVAEISAGPPGLYLWGGETTVNLPAKPGRGGRNQQLALAAALELAGRDDICLLAAGTDGSDGPTEDAGALVDGGTVARGALQGLDAAECLARADAGSLLAASGDLLNTGPTGTNVTDLVIAFRQP